MYYFVTYSPGVKLKILRDLLWYFNTSNSWVNINMEIGTLYPVNSLLVSRYQ